MAKLVAVDNLTRICMQELGYEFHSPTAAEYRAGIEWRTRYGAAAFPAGDLRDTGEPPETQPTDQDPNEAYLSGLEPAGREAWDEALGGTGETRTFTIADASVVFSTDGCKATAFESVVGDPTIMRPAQFLIGNIESIAHSLTQSDQRIIDATAEWQRCMQEHGYQFSEFGQARFARESASDAVTQADLNCSHAAGLSDAYRSVFDKQIATLYESNRDAIDAYRQQMRDVLDAS